MKKIKRLTRSLWFLKRKNLFKTLNIRQLSRRPDGFVTIVVDMGTSNLTATNFMVTQELHQKLEIRRLRSLLRKHGESKEVNLLRLLTLLLKYLLKKTGTLTVGVQDI